MHPDRVRWNEKHKGSAADLKPASLVRAWHHLAPKGRVLDLAAGLGGNALFLASKGCIVDAVDISDTAVKRLKTLHPGVRPILADLSAFPLPEEKYQMILNLHFLKRSLFETITQALAPGGVLLFETHLHNDLPGVDGPSNPAFRLKPNELLRAFPALEVLYYREGLRRQGKSRLCLASLAARRPA